MKSSMDNIKTVVFDLDGTLYQNDTFHRDYIHFLLEGSGREDWEDTLIDYIDGVYAGCNLVMNACYCNDTIEADTPEAFFAVLEQRRLEELPLKQSNSIYLGDGWAVVSLIGKALGLLDKERSDNIYHKTRDKMSTDGVQGNWRLRDAIVQLNKKFTTVLLTNSYRETTEDFLHQLGMEGLFEKMVCSAHKPWGMVESLKAYCPELEIEPESFLSIGDNAFNDLLPLQKLGCRTIWVDPFSSTILEMPCDYTVHTLDELAECLETLCRKSDSSL